MTRQFRQGDILLVEVASIPEGARHIAHCEDRIVIAEGEATGHAHQIVAAGAELLEASPDERFLRVLAEGGVELTHEEHAAILLPRGDYRVARQREYVPDDVRRVAD